MKYLLSTTLILTLLGCSSDSISNANQKIWSSKSTKVTINLSAFVPDVTKRNQKVSFLKEDLSKTKQKLLKNIDFYNKADKNCMLVEDLPRYTIRVTDEGNITNTYHADSSNCSLNKDTKLIKFDDARNLFKLDKFIDCPQEKISGGCATYVEPVCATSLDGTTISYETVSNSCFACQESKVIGYTEGGCN